MDLIRHIELTNVRTFAHATLDLDGLSVVIGENGVGKSTLVEVCEILRRLPSAEFTNQFFSLHRAPQLFRHGETNLALAVTIADADGRLPSVRYHVAWTRIDGGAVISEESITEFEPNEPAVGRRLLFRDPSGGWVLDLERKETVALSRLQLDTRYLSLGLRIHLPPHPAIARLAAALEQIHVHLPLDPTPAWAASAQNRPLGLRGSAPLVPVDRVGLGALNLANVYQALKNDFGDDHWRETMELVRLGLGDRIESVAVRPDAASNVALWLKYRIPDMQVPASGLSDGVLAWLTFVALDRLRVGRSLLVIDEVDLHLHPALLSRVLDLCASVSARHPVLLTTHADRLLDLLPDPAREVVLAEGQPDGTTTLRRPDPQALEAWMARYGGYGRLRAEGYEFALYPEKG